MKHLRLFVEFPADAVTAVLAHHRAVLGFGVPLDGVADVAKADAGPYHLDADAQTFVGHLADAPRGNRRGTCLLYTSRCV